MFDIFQTVNEEYSSDEHMRNREQQTAPQPSSFQSDIFVVSIGGSLLFDENGPSAAKVKTICDAISSLHSSGKRFCLVVGGGRAAREYVNALREINPNNFGLDLLGIHITRANAMLVANALPNAHKEILTEILRAKSIIDSGKIPIFGGLMPFFTTDSVAALVAEHLGATFVNLTNVDGIYDVNPNENPGAKRFDEIGYNKLVAMIASSGSTPGQNVVLDLACCMILRRSALRGVVLSGNDMTNFSNFVNGYTFTGTVIRQIEGEPMPEDNLIEKMDEINEDVPQRKRAKKRKSGKHGPINPYEIDF